MMAFTADGQVKPELVAERDARYGVSTAGGLGAPPGWQEVKERGGAEVQC